MYFYVFMMYSPRAQNTTRYTVNTCWILCILVVCQLAVHNTCRYANTHFDTPWYAMIRINTQCICIPPAPTSCINTRIHMYLRRIFKYSRVFTWIRVFTAYLRVSACIRMYQNVSDAGGCCVTDGLWIRLYSACIWYVFDAIMSRVRIHVNTS